MLSLLTIKVLIKKGPTNIFILRTFIIYNVVIVIYIYLSIFKTSVLYLIFQSSIILIYIQKKKKKKHLRKTKTSYLEDYMS